MMALEQELALEIAWRLGCRHDETYTGLTLRVLGTEAALKLVNHLEHCAYCKEYPNYLALTADGFKTLCLSCVRDIKTPVPHINLAGISWLADRC